VKLNLLFGEAAIPVSCCFLAWLTLQPWKWRQYFFPKHWLTFTEQQRSIRSRVRGSAWLIVGFYSWWLDLLNVPITTALDYNRSHIELLLDNESLTVVWLLHWCLASSLLLEFWAWVTLTSHFALAWTVSVSLKHTNSLLTACFGLSALSESELLYDWRFNANQFVLATSPLKPTTRIFIFQLNTCGHSPYVTSSLTRGWVCRLQLLLGLASAVILRSESRGTHNHILLSQIRDTPNLEGQVPVFISPRNRVAQL
jgi:hypothetical protein